MELYNDRAALAALEAEMAAAFAARSAELRTLDAARETDPYWYRRGAMQGMTMYTDLFDGNLKKLAKKLPYLREQGVTCLHLMPLLKMPHPHNDGGYAVENFDTVDPGLGTNADLAALTKQLRGGHQPMPGFRDESHRRYPPLGAARQGRRPGVPKLLLLLPRPDHPRPV